MAKNQKNEESNSPKIGEVYLSISTGLKFYFYEVKQISEDAGKATWIKMDALQFDDSIEIPLLYFDKLFVRVNESTVEILFNRRREENGNANKKG